MTDDLRDRVRAGLAARVARSYGVCASGSDVPDVPLSVEIIPTEEPQGVSKARVALANTWARPDGEELITAMECAEVDRQLRLGGYYTWSWEPDREWLRVRKEYRKAQRSWLQAHPTNTIDSPERLERAIKRGEITLPEAAPWFRAKASGYVEPPKAWQEIDGAPEIRMIWSSCLELIGPAVVFGARVSFAEGLANAIGAPFYGAGPEAAKGILSEEGSRTIVASLGAHGQGRNLQAWRSAVILDPPPSGARWEQILGRLHRPGQKASEVTYYVSAAWADETHKALADARWLASSLGQAQRLLVAERKGIWYV